MRTSATRTCGVLVARRRRLASGAPERLCRFVASEWPGACCPRSAAALWRRACLAWLAGEPGRSLPFGEHGDVVDVMSAEGRAPGSAAVPASACVMPLASVSNDC